MNKIEFGEKFSAEKAYSYAVNWKAINKYLNLIKIYRTDETMRCVYARAMRIAHTSILVKHRVIFLTRSHFSFLQIIYIIQVLHL